MSKYTRKTRDYWKVEQYTGPLYSWEEVCGSHDRKEAYASLRDYKKNQPEYPARIVKTREKVDPRLILEEVCSRCGNRIQLFAWEGNEKTLYSASEGATISPSGQFVTCNCASFSQFFLSAYGIKFPKNWKVKKE